MGGSYILLRQMPKGKRYGVPFAPFAFGLASVSESVADFRFFRILSWSLTRGHRLRGFTIAKFSLSRIFNEVFFWKNLFNELLNSFKRIFLRIITECEVHSFAASASSSSDTVTVAFSIYWNVEVDHVAHTFYINSASGDISGHEEFNYSGFKI